MAPSGKGSSSSEDVQTGAVFSISGPVVVAENMIGCAMYELVSAPRATWSASSVSRSKSPLLSVALLTRHRAFLVSSRP